MKLWDYMVYIVLMIYLMEKSKDADGFVYVILLVMVFLLSMGLAEKHAKRKK